MLKELNINSNEGDDKTDMKNFKENEESNL